MQKPPDRNIRPCMALLVLALVWLGQGRMTYAQSRPAAEVQYTFALVGIPLADALERLIDETRLSLVYETDRVAGRTTFCKAEQVPAEELLACILRDTGLDYVQLSSGTYVLIDDPRTVPRYASLIGQVLDAETGMPLADASVLLASEHAGTATNQDGRFAFAALRPGPHRLVVTHVAYHDAADTVYVTPETPSRISVPLRPRMVLSAPVIVSAFETRLPSEELGTERRTAEELATAQGLGAPDVVQNLDAVVGVRLGDALSDVHVQGGAANEQHFLLDGVPVFVPVPNGGFIGPFGPFAVGQVTVQKAGFGAAHGSGLSGVIEVEHRLAPDERPRLTVQVDPISLNARWNGGVALKRRTEAAWMIALRKGLWDLYQPDRLETVFQRWATPDRFLIEALHAPVQDPQPVDPADGGADGPLEVGVNDLHAAVRVQFGSLRSLRFSFYRGANRFGIDDATPSAGDVGTEPPDTFEEDVFEDAYRWRNHTAQLRYEWVQSRRLFMNANVWGTDYRLAHPANLGTTEALASTATTSDEFNELAEIGVRLGGDLAATARHTLSGALEAAHTDSDFSVSLDPLGAAPAGPEDVRPVRWRLAAFLENRVALSHRATLTLGMRLTYLPLKKTTYAEPRLAVQYDHEAGAHGAWAVRGAVGLYRQYLHAFDVATYNVTALLPRVRFWLPVGRGQRPPEAYHATAAFLYRPDAVWRFGVEAYYKHQPHLLVLDYGSQEEIAEPQSVIRDVLTDADGYAYGMALTASRKGRRVQFDAQYEYAIARRRVANRFDGAFVPVPWDAPHRLYLALDILPLLHWTATVRWQGIFGRSWGFRQAYYDFLEPNPATQQFMPFDLSDPAAHRLPAFAQWDAGLAYTRTIAGVNVQARVTFINVLGRRNVTDWSLRYDEEAEAYIRQPRRAAAFIPSFSLRLGL